MEVVVGRRDKHTRDGRSSLRKEAPTSPGGDPGRWTFGSSAWMLMLIAYARSEAVRRLLVKMAIY